MKTNLSEILETQGIGESYAVISAKMISSRSFNASSDPLTYFIGEAYTDAASNEDFIDHLEYAIEMLKRAKRAVE